MADRFNNSLSGLRQGGYLNDLMIQAYDRPPLSMPMNSLDQTEERTLLGGSYQMPLHAEKLPLGMKYGTDEYETWRTMLMHQRALQQGVSTEVLQHRNGPRDDNHAMKWLNRLTWARGEGSGRESTHRGTPANTEAQGIQSFIERKLWHEALGIPYTEDKR